MLHTHSLKKPREELLLMAKNTFMCNITISGGVLSIDIKSQ